MSDITIHSATSSAACRTADVQLAEWLAEYSTSRQPLTVDFRALAPFRSGEDRATHLLHPYPAKLLLNIPYFFLKCTSVCPPGSTVLDPFCGSGTVLVEAGLAEVRGDGADSNPLARLLTAAKTSPISKASVERELAAILAGMPDHAVPPEGVINIDHWFPPRTSIQLARLRIAVLQHASEATSAFFLSCFSACVRKSSLADPRLSVPVRLNPERRHIYGAKGDAALRRLDSVETLDAVALFSAIVRANAERVQEYAEGIRGTYVPALFNDARRIERDDGFYDLVVTSPPYLGAQKYVRASSLSLGWLGLTPKGTTRPLERLSIGREHMNVSERRPIEPTGILAADELLAQIEQLNPLRAQLAAAYLREMKSSLEEIARVTKCGGHLVLVMGANLIAGLPFPTPAFVRELAEGAGFALKLHLQDTIRSRGLMTKRNKTAGIIDQESIFLMERR